MRDKGLILLVSFVLASFFVPVAEAQWSNITTDADAERFIELFWARRNPDPASTFNPFRAEFESKVRYAEDNFSYGSRSGAASDRAKVLILMGKPKGIQVRAATSSVPGIDNSAGSGDEVQGATQVWVYNPAELPDGLKVKGAELFFMFYEEKLNSNNFTLDRSARESFKGLSALTDAPEAYLLHPNLKEIPKPVSIEGGSPASAASIPTSRRSRSRFPSRAARRLLPRTSHGSTAVKRRLMTSPS
jgi:GWxTD domain-containing protein